MKFWPHGVHWRARLRWYERACLVLWWFSLIFAGACLGAAAAVAYSIGLTRAAIEGAVAVTLAGFAVVLISRFLLAWAIRRGRRRRVDIY